jgi:hypothetical protein
VNKARDVCVSRRPRRSDEKDWSRLKIVRDSGRLQGHQASLRRFLFDLPGKAGLGYKASWLHVIQGQFLAD